MTDPMHQQLLGHLLGALDDDEQHVLDERLEHDEEFCSALLQWRRRLAPLESMRPDYEPPPGLAERTCRYVAAYPPISDEAPSQGSTGKMSDSPAPPGWIASVGWPDAAVVILLLAIAVFLVFPAIENSRFESRVASCQEGLRQLGLVLMQYSDQQPTELAGLADNGRLTPAGLFAIGRLRDGCVQRTVCPNAWLAAQGIPCMMCDETRSENATRLGPGLAYVAGAEVPAKFPPQPRSRGADSWLGTWRNGTTDGWRPSRLSAEVPLLADAPSADLPGQNYPSHGGRGRNILFQDGHGEFLPSAAPLDTADAFLSGGERFTAPSISAPIVYVSGH